MIVGSSDMKVHSCTVPSWWALVNRVPVALKSRYSRWSVTGARCAYGMLSLPMIAGRQRMTRIQPLYAEQKLPAYVPQADRA